MVIYAFYSIKVASHKQLIMHNAHNAQLRIEDYSLCIVSYLVHKQTNFFRNYFGTLI